MKGKLIGWAAALAAAFPLSAWPQAWPAKPVRLIVPFAPGGAVDVTARTIAQALTARPSDFA